MWLKVAEIVGYCQRALYHEMQWQLAHMDVLARRAGDGESGPSISRRQGDAAARSGVGFPAASSQFWPGQRALRRAVPDLRCARIPRI